MLWRSGRGTLLLSLSFARITGLMVENCIFDLLSESCPLGEEVRSCTMLRSGLLRFGSNVMLFAAKMALVVCLTLSYSIGLSNFDLIWIWLAPITMLSTIDLLSADVSCEDRGFVEIFGEILLRLVFGWKNSCYNSYEGFGRFFGL